MIKENNMYTPDNWVKIKLPDINEHKIVAGWSGGYLDGDSWKINSGIKKEEEHEDYIDYIGYSGSIYRCYKGREKISIAIVNVLDVMLKSGCTIVRIWDDV